MARPLSILLAAVLLAGCGGTATPSGDEPAAIIHDAGTSTSPYGGLVRDPAPEVGALRLPDVADGGRPYRLRGPEGGLLLLFLGFTNCPDVCPTTLADLRTVMRETPAADRDRIAFAMITVDPERDTGRVLVPYVDAFFPGGAALRTADDARLRRIAKALAADYAVTTSADGATEVVHTSFLYAIDDRGRVLVQWPFGTTVDTLRADLATALGQIAPPTQEAS